MPPKPLRCWKIRRTKSALDHNGLNGYEESLKSFEEADRTCEKLISLLKDPREKAEAEAVRAGVAQFRAGISDLIKATSALTLAGRRASDIASKLGEEIESISSVGILRTVKIAKESQSQLEASFNKVLIGIVVALLFTAIISFLSTRLVTLPVRACVAAMERLAHGDLTVRTELERGDELGTLAKAINSSIGSIADNIAAAVEEQSATTSEIVRSLHTVTDATNTLATNVKLATAGSIEVSRNIHGVSEAAIIAAGGSARIQAGATELNAMANSLSELVKNFVVDQAASTELAPEVESAGIENEPESCSNVEEAILPVVSPVLQRWANPVHPAKAKLGQTGVREAREKEYASIS